MFFRVVSVSMRVPCEPLRNGDSEEQGVGDAKLDQLHHDVEKRETYNSKRIMTTQKAVISLVVAT